MLNKSISFVLSFFIFFSLTPALYAHEYKDVRQGSSYYYPVDYLRRNDVFKDTDYFYPDRLITKAEFIRYLVDLNSPDFKAFNKVKLPFEDTKDNAWYASYFKEAIKLGILDDRQKKVEPDKKLTVFDALRLLFHSQSIPIPNVYKGKYPYKDLLKNKHVAPLVMRAMELDIIAPQQNDLVGIYKRVTRAEAARMIYKMDLVTLGTSTSNGLPQISTQTPELEKIVSVWERIQTSYLKRDKLDNAAIADSVLKTLVEQLGDPYSVYLNGKQNQSFKDSLGGQIEGIGAVIGFNEAKEVTVVSPIKDSPADKAGLLAKDVILAVDEVEVAGMALEEIVAIIKGPKGSTVKLKLRRDAEVKELIIKRDVIIVKSVEYQTIENGSIMLITLNQFGNNSTDQFNQAVSALKADQAVKGLIIDLRGNPGGYLDAAVKIVGHFVDPQKEVVSIDYADYSQVLLSSGKGLLKGIPTVILIDNGSASASEILAGALKDYALATLVGEKSFGKGTVQEVNYLLDNSSLKLTIARWLTPLRHSIQDEGIEPDVPVAQNEDTPADEVLDQGVIELKKLMK